MIEGREKAKIAKGKGYRERYMRGVEMVNKKKLKKD